MRRHLPILLALVLALTSVFSGFALAEEPAYKQAPMLDAMVESGELPPVADRLPNNPKLINESSPEALEYEIGTYGGTVRFITNSVNYDGDLFISCTENILNMVDSNSDEITPNLVESFTVNDDNTEFTFTLREGLKWSDGTPVTIEDYRFAIEDFIFNEELNPKVSAMFRSGGATAGAPMTYEFIDDSSFKLSFDSSYGGFLVYMSIKGWAGYTEILKPAHFLKQFHKDYAEEIHGSIDDYYAFIAPFAAALGYDDPSAEQVWVYVFNQVDMGNKELTDPNDALTSVFFEGLIDKNMPVLYPFIMESSNDGLTVFVRNPYYHKVDAEGQQLPYVDYLTSSFAESQDLLQLGIMSGEVDWARMTATIDNVSLYRENEDKGGYTTYIRTQHITPTNVVPNFTYGLNADGTVKEDEASQTWQEVIHDIRFMQALAYAIDPEEIILSVYSGFADINTEYCNAKYDPEYAMQLLDEMGMIDTDGDGYRETPSGKQFQWMIWNYDEASDIIPVAELYVQYWDDIGLKCTVNTTDKALLSTMLSANEVPMRCMWIHEGELWHYGDWGIGNWAKLYQLWYDHGGLRGEATDQLTPPEHVIDFYEVYDTLYTVTPEDAVNVVVPTLRQMVADNYFFIVPITNVSQCFIANADLGNIPNDTVCACAIGFVVEQVFYRTPQ